MHGEWFADTELWHKFRPFMFDGNTNEDARCEVDLLLTLSGKSSCPVIDFCCGFGRHAIALSQAGCTVTGIDIDASFIAEARIEAQARQQKVELIRADVREQHFHEEFDLAVNLYSSFGYFENPEDDLRFCQNAHSALKKAGIFIIETIAKETFRNAVPAKSWRKIGDTVLLCEQKSEGACCFLSNSWTVIENGHCYSREFSQRLYSAYELAMLLEKAGFSSSEFFGDFSGSQYNEESRRLIAVAKK